MREGFEPLTLTLCIRLLSIIETRRRVYQISPPHNIACLSKLSSRHRLTGYECSFHIYINDFCTRGGSRTLNLRLLRPLRLPVPPPRHLVLEAGIEPALLREQDFKSCVSTYSTTRAFMSYL